MTTILTPLRAAAFAAASILFTSGSAFAQAGNGDFAGTVTDPATGFRCVTAACDTVVTPDNSCICQKLNPNAMTAAEVSLRCTTGAAQGNQMCTPPKFGK